MHRALRIALLVLIALSGAAVATAAQPGASPVPETASPVAATPASAGQPAAWLELGPDNTIVARAISDGACPRITLDEDLYDMDVRAEPTADHPVTVCETTVPPATERVLVGETSLKMPVADPQRILVIGDTGCRVKDGDAIQACNDPAAWPFAEIAARGAAWQPDLIIHVGDYHYREAACPEGNAGCAGSPWGDNWATWQADFFAPVAPLLAEAPWIFIRGNHEDCNRAGNGWFRYLDPRPMPASCEDFTEPYALTIGDVRAVVLDDASASDTSPEPETTEVYRTQFAEVERLAGGGPAWLLTHRPFWSIGADGSGNPAEWSVATFTAAGYEQPPAGIDLVIAGHVHMAQVLTFTEESGRPAVIVAGNSGTSVEMTTTEVTGDDLGDETLVRGWRWAEYGFTGLERVDTGWVVTLPMIAGTVPLSCLMTDAAVACVP
jgi:predicted phosphodiesterase